MYDKNLNKAFRNYLEGFICKYYYLDTIIFLNQWVLIDKFFKIDLQIIIFAFIEKIIYAKKWK